MAHANSIRALFALCLLIGVQACCLLVVLVFRPYISRVLNAVELLSCILESAALGVITAMYYYVQGDIHAHDATTMVSERALVLWFDLFCRSCAAWDCRLPADWHLRTRRHWTT